MPLLTTTPDVLQPYLSHGVVFGRPASDQYEGDCPFCGRDGKFAVNVKDGRFRCRVCATGTDRGGGNATTFVRLIWELSPEPTDADLEELRQDRKLLYANTLRAWGVRKSFLTGEWVIPGYNQDRQMVNLYRYRYPPTKPGAPPAKKKSLVPTRGLSHGLFGAHLYDKDKPDLWILEGPWDGMAAWELCRIAKPRPDGGYDLTGSEGMSVYSTTNVVAVPGVTSWPDRWCVLGHEKRVRLLYDNDHPKEWPVNSGKHVRAGWDGMRYVTRQFAGNEHKPEEIKYLTWGDAWHQLANGYDFRDHVSLGDDPKQRLGQLKFITDSLDVPPADWIPGRSATTHAKGSTDIELIECTSWKPLVQQWAKALEWPDTPGTGLDHGLAVMLAANVAIRMPEDQLWVTIISPPSTGKTTLAEAMGLARKWTKETGTFRGFHSGFQSDGEGKEDHGLLPQVKDKLFIIKDGDTILKAPNRDQIFAEMRDAYDTNSATSYRNKVKRDYRGYRFGICMCGTESMLEMDSAELGARFLMCVIVDKIEERMETNINLRRFRQLVANKGVEANGDMKTHYGPELLKAKQMTGGYVDFLRRNATDLLGGLAVPDAVGVKFDQYARFVAHMRSRPAKKQDEVTGRELSARLCSQLTKLGLCLSVVLNKKTVDKDVMERVRKVALDTSRGRTLLLCKHLFDAKQKGTSLGTLIARTDETEDSERKLLRHLRRIGVAEVVKVGSIQRWRLTKSFTVLYRKVMFNA